MKHLFIKSEQLARLLEVKPWHVVDNARRSGAYMGMTPIRKSGPRSAFMWRITEVEQLLGRKLTDEEVA